MPPQAHLLLGAPFWDSSLNQESNEDRAGYILKREMTRPQSGDFYPIHPVGIHTVKLSLDPPQWVEQG